ncbi:hypothetical protein CC80DRAFT_26296 [Byssothecium circinans]|uniref:Uncharacterized protein n=1 Tax=Byssothecium circinans TaxID=147558 RepID=A0A6A5U304_9PLEO|nr:hypothetical protein CC80DRAFT_26296 [Byssothecium circinans]
MCTRTWGSFTTMRYCSSHSLPFTICGHTVGLFLAPFLTVKVTKLLGFITAHTNSTFPALSSWRNPTSTEVHYVQGVFRLWGSEQG